MADRTAIGSSTGAFRRSLRRLLHPERSVGLPPSPATVERATSGVWNTLRRLGTVSEDVDPLPEPRVLHGFRIVTPDRGGLFADGVELGREVAVGDRLARVIDPFDDVVEEINAPVAGVVLTIPVKTAVGTWHLGLRGRLRSAGTDDQASGLVGRCANEAADGPASGPPARAAREGSRYVVGRMGSGEQETLRETAAEVAQPLAWTSSTPSLVDTSPSEPAKRKIASTNVGSGLTPISRSTNGFGILSSRSELRGRDGENYPVPKSSMSRPRARSRCTHATHLARRARPRLGDPTVIRRASILARVIATAAACTSRSSVSSPGATLTRSPGARRLGARLATRPPPGGPVPERSRRLEDQTRLLRDARTRPAQEPAPGCSQQASARTPGSSRRPATPPAGSTRRTRPARPLAQLERERSPSSDPVVQCRLEQHTAGPRSWPCTSRGQLRRSFLRGARAGPVTRRRCSRARRPVDRGQRDRRVDHVDQAPGRSSAPAASVSRTSTANSSPRGARQCPAVAPPHGSIRHLTAVRRRPRNPPAIVHDLETVEVEEQDGVGSARRRLIGERLVESLCEQEPVRQLGQRIRVRLMMELFLELRDLGERTLETAVLEQHARVTRERLQERDVFPGERADIADPVAHQQDAEGPLLACEAARSHVETAGAEEPVERVARAPTREQDRLGRACDRPDRALVDGGNGHTLHQAFTVLAAHALKRFLARHRREQEDLGVVGAEQGDGSDQQLAHREAELRGTLRRAHRLVEELDPFTLLTLVHVRGTRRHRRSPAARATRAPRGRALQLDDQQPQTAGGQRPDRRDDEHPAELRGGEQTLGDGDHRRDEQHPTACATTAARSAANQVEMPCSPPSPRSTGTRGDPGG